MNIEIFLQNSFFILWKITEWFHCHRFLKSLYCPTTLFLASVQNLCQHVFQLVFRRAPLLFHINYFASEICFYHEYFLPVSLVQISPKSHWDNFSSTIYIFQKYCKRNSPLVHCNITEFVEMSRFSDNQLVTPVLIHPCASRYVWNWDLSYFESWILYSKLLFSICKFLEFIHFNLIGLTNYTTFSKQP